jgi:hypothetical protein
MYQFMTLDGVVYVTVYSPKEIAQFVHFDSYDCKGNSCVVYRYEVDFESFEYLKN